MILGRGVFVVGALFVSALLASACIYDFDIPGDTGDTDAAHACAENKTCTIDCVGGNCGPNCAANSTCNIECTGGTCHSYCAANSTCNIECTGGTCHTECQGKCSISCTGGTCDCQGPGCQ